MSSPAISYFDDKDLDDAALWAAIDSAAAASSLSSIKSRKPLALKNSPIPKPNPSPHVQLPKHSRNSHNYPHGEVLQNKPPKFARLSTPCVSEVSETSPLALAKVNHVQRTPTTPIYASPDDCKRINTPRGSECSPVSYHQFDDSGGNTSMTHCLSGRFPTVSLFKEYQNAAMAILEKSDYTMISGHPFIKKTGWRKISFYFNVSYEIRDKTIEFDENRNVIRAEFVVRAFMQGGRFSDGWGSCERREKKFSKPNHDIPSTAETRAKNKACQDLLGIGEYRPGASHHVK